MDKEEGGLVLRADIFNVFNLDSGIEKDEFGETAGGAVNRRTTRLRRLPSPALGALRLRLGVLSGSSLETRKTAGSHEPAVFLCASPGRERGRAAGDRLSAGRRPDLCRVSACPQPIRRDLSLFRVMF
jgi:hypothetical protein